MKKNLTVLLFWIFCTFGWALTFDELYFQALSEGLGVERLHEYWNICEKTEGAVPSVEGFKLFLIPQCYGEEIEELYRLFEEANKK